LKYLSTGQDQAAGEEDWSVILCEQQQQWKKEDSGRDKDGLGAASGDGNPQSQVDSGHLSQGAVNENHQRWNQEDQDQD